MGIKFGMARLCKVEGFYLRCTLVVLLLLLFSAYFHSCGKTASFCLPMQLNHFCSLLFILLWVSFLYGCGIWLFSSGFLLKRLVIERNSSCSDFGGVVRSASLLQESVLSSCAQQPRNSLRGDANNDKPINNPNTPSCWSSARFKRAVIIIIDGLRHDFAIVDDAFGNSSKMPYYKNKFLAFSDVIHREPQNGVLFRFVADPPTTTLQRLKSLMTGSLPTFIDMSSNFASYEISEDSLIRQLQASGKNITFMGDDTWDGLFPNMFHRSYFYPSFNVKDLHTVDNGIMKHLVPEMNKSDWDVLIAHFLGVDHCGHRFGPSHPAMAEKLQQMDQMIRKVLENLPKDSILFVFGDHGMTQTGDHGGDSKDEVTSVLFAYSHKGVTSESQGHLSSVSQVDFVPTVALLLGIPVPFSSIGSVIEPLFTSGFSPETLSHQHCSVYNGSINGIANALALLSALRVNVAQVHRYLTLYASASGSFTKSSIQKMNVTLDKLESMWKWMNSEKLQRDKFHEALMELKQEYSLFLQHIKMLCVQMWTKYDLYAIMCGLIVLSLVTLFVMLVAFVYSSTDASSIALRLIIGICIAICLSSVLEFLNISPLSTFLDSTLLVISVVSVLSCMWGISKGPTKLLGNSLSERSTFVGIALQALHFAGFFSNSFIVYEDRVVPFLLETLLTISVLPLILQFNDSGTRPKRKHFASNIQWELLATLFVLMACVRFGFVFRKCREEQQPCESSIFVPPLHSLPPELHDIRNMRLATSCIALLLIGLLAIWFLKENGNLGKYTVAGLCVRYLFPSTYLCICFHWMLGLFPQHVLQRHLQQNQEVLAQAALVQIGIVIFLIWLSPICCDDSDLASSKSKYSSSLTVFLFATLGLLAILAGDGMALSQVIEATEAFLYLCCLSKILTARKGVKGRPLFVPWICVATWEQLSANGFFATGHQNTLSTIPWHAAFIGTTGELTNHIIPGIQVLTNIFSSYILFGLSLPLLLTWCTRSGIRFSSIITIMGNADENLPDQDELVSLTDKHVFRWRLLQMVLQYLMLHGIKLLGTACACAIHRRHLMVWKIFAPRFMFSAVGMGFTVLSCILGFLFVVRIDIALRAARQKSAYHYR